MVVIFLLVGCSSITGKKPAPVITIEPTEPTEQPTTPTSPETVPQLPKVKTVDWSTAVIPLANQLVQAPGVESGKVLLIDSIKIIPIWQFNQCKQLMRLLMQLITKMYLN